MRIVKEIHFHLDDDDDEEDDDLMDPMTMMAPEDTHFYLFYLLNALTKNSLFV